MATATIYPSSDGWARYTSGVDSWATMVAKATGSSANNSDANNRVYVDWKSDASNAYIDRGFLAFDTSVLGAGVTITAATLSLYVNSVLTADGGSVNVFSGSQAATLTTADYSAVGTTAYATAIGVSSLTNNAYNTWTLNGTALAALNPAGTSKYAVRLSQDYTTTQPSLFGYSFMQFASVRTTGTSQDPYLTVTYTPAPGGRVPVRRCPSGLYTR